MPSILIVAHTPLASSLQTVARHAFADCGKELAAVDIPPSADLDHAQALIGAAVAGLPHAEVLMLVDAFGATPSNAAMNVADGARCRVVTGVNVPMLWRTLCYAHLPLDELVVRAVDGARNGIMQVTSPRRQNQPNRPPNNDPESNSDQ